MLPKKSKLSVEKFPHKAKTVFKGSYFTLKTTPGDGKLAILISKGYAKKAFLRNSIRRLVYSFFKDNNELSGINLLVILNNPIMKLDSQGKNFLKEELELGRSRIK